MCVCNKLMDIAYWNIHGLNEEKFEVDLFISSVCKYDIICFSETMVGGSPGNLPGFSSPFIVKPTKKRKRGRPSYTLNPLLDKVRQR